MGKLKKPNFRTIYKFPKIVNDGTEKVTPGNVERAKKCTKMCLASVTIPCSEPISFLKKERKQYESFRF